MKGIDSRGAYHVRMCEIICLRCLRRLFFDSFILFNGTGIDRGILSFGVISNLSTFVSDVDRYI